ncbi:MAG TPA: asparagine synthetase B [Verrucomicrobiae bacterium]|nr:asparagine synthetase B [Verrucomicrobiae bacterium]
MCSIIGFVDKRPRNVAEALTMLTQTRHRGPDAVGLYIDGRIEQGKRLSQIKLPPAGMICLGHARLEIVGGPSGLQPLLSCDGKLSLIHNGEIYNYRELRQLLSRHQVATESDSEVLVHLIEEFYQGDLAAAVKQAMPLLDGMYAFAVTDGSCVVLARDPVGKKPVYYVEGFPFYFASEPKALRGARREIERLRPGHILVADRNRITVQVGYEIEESPIRLTHMEAAIREYGIVFDRALDKRVFGLGRAAVLLSGGVDSTLVARAIANRGIQVTGYCAGVRDSLDVQNAMHSAEQMNIPLRITYLDEKIVQEILPAVIEAIELNGMVQVEAAVPMFLAAKMASEDGHKVLFTGQGADELFGGYAWYCNVVAEHGHLTLHKRMWEDINKLYLDTLEREDRMTMAHSIELRAPFLDRDLIHKAMQISPRLKVKGPEDTVRKWVHREFALRQGVPAFIAKGEKVRAQDGSAIPAIIQALAEKHFAGRDVPETFVTDYGSNYRYLEEQYGTPEMAAFLVEITRRHHIHIFDGVNEERSAAQ